MTHPEIPKTPEGVEKSPERQLVDAFTECTVGGYASLEEVYEATGMEIAACARVLQGLIERGLLAVNNSTEFKGQEGLAQLELLLLDPEAVVGTGDTTAA